MDRSWGESGLNRKLNEHTPAPGMDRANLHPIDGSQEHERTLSRAIRQPLRWHTDDGAASPRVVECLRYPLGHLRRRRLGKGDGDDAIVLERRPAPRKHSPTPIPRPPARPAPGDHTRDQRRGLTGPCARRRTMGRSGGSRDLAGGRVLYQTVTHRRAPHPQRPAGCSAAVFGDDFTASTVTSHRTVIQHTLLEPRSSRRGETLFLQVPVGERWPRAA